MNLEIGTIIDGKHQILDILGRGGMSVVYEGVHKRVQRRVAIKVLDEKFVHDSVMISRFEWEARASALIGSPHVVEAFDIGELEGGVPYFIMEFLEGESLQERLRREGRLSPRKVFEIGAQLLAGLEAAHRADVIHRDVKPANVFLVADAEGNDFVKILDFGVSKFRPLDVTQNAMVLGSPSYLAPEQTHGAPVDERSDVYAAGAVMYRALTGRPPYVAKNLLDLVEQLVMSSPPPLRELAPKIPAKAASVVEKAIARNPEDRFPSATAFRSAVLAWLEADAGSTTKDARPSGSVEPSAPSKRKRIKGTMALGTRLSAEEQALVDAALGGAPSPEEASEAATKRPGAPAAAAAKKRDRAPSGDEMAAPPAATTRDQAPSSGDEVAAPRIRRAARKAGPTLAETVASRLRRNIQVQPIPGSQPKGEPSEAETATRDTSEPPDAPSWIPSEVIRRALEGPVVATAISDLPDASSEPPPSWVPSEVRSEAPPDSWQPPDAESSEPPASREGALETIPIQASSKPPARTPAAPSEPSAASDHPTLAMPRPQADDDDPATIAVPRRALVAPADRDETRADGTPGADGIPDADGTPDPDGTASSDGSASAATPSTDRGGTGDGAPTSSERTLGRSRTSRRRRAQRDPALERRAAAARDHRARRNPELADATPSPPGVDAGAPEATIAPAPAAPIVPNPRHTLLDPAPDATSSWRSQWWLAVAFLVGIAVSSWWLFLR